MGKIYVFWDVTPCYWTIMSRCFETMFLLRKIEDYSTVTQGFFPGRGGGGGGRIFSTTAVIT